MTPCERQKAIDDINVIADGLKRLADQYDQLCHYATNFYSDPFIALTVSAGKQIAGSLDQMSLTLEMLRLAGQHTGEPKQVPRSFLRARL